MMSTTCSMVNKGDGLRNGVWRCPIMEVSRFHTKTPPPVCVCVNSRIQNRTMSLCVANFSGLHRGRHEKLKGAPMSIFPSAGPQGGSPHAWWCPVQRELMFELCHLMTWHTTNMVGGIGITKIICPLYSAPRCSSSCSCTASSCD